VFPGHIHNGGFDADLTGTTIENQVHAIAEFLPHMSNRSGTDVTEAVGRRRRNTSAESIEQRLSYRMGWHAQSDSVLSASHLVDYGLGTLDNKRERPGPEAPASCLTAGGFRWPTG
jgi:hypothetical protein